MSTLPFSGIKAFLIILPSSLLMGIFCKFGSDEANLPVDVVAIEKEE